MPEGKGYRNTVKRATENQKTNKIPKPNPDVNNPSKRIRKNPGNIPTAFDSIRDAVQKRRRKLDDAAR